KDDVGLRAAGCLPDQDTGLVDPHQLAHFPRRRVADANLDRQRSERAVQSDKRVRVATIPERFEHAIPPLCRLGAGCRNGTPPRNDSVPASLRGTTARSAGAPSADTRYGLPVL